MPNEKYRYSNLAHWSQEEWRNINIHLFIAANFTRYCSSLVKRVGQQYLPNDAVDSLLGLFCDVAWKPLKTVHERNLDAQGDRRNQIMLGTLKMITVTRMVDALIREFPNHVAIDQLPGFVEDNQYEDEDDDDNLNHLNCPQDFEPSQRALFAAEDYAALYEVQEQEECIEDERISTMLEQMRSTLTPVQFRHLRYAICGRMDATEIAELTGRSVTNARIVLLKTRKRMIDLVPPDMLETVADCVLRK